MACWFIQTPMSKGAARTTSPQRPKRNFDWRLKTPPIDSGRRESRRLDLAAYSGLLKIGEPMPISPLNIWAIWKGLMEDHLLDVFSSSAPLRGRETTRRFFG